MNRSIAWRSPAVGVVAPSSTVEVAYQLPIDLKREYPVVLTAVKNSLQVVNVEQHRVTLRNEGVTPVPYLLIVVPQSAITAATTDWKQVIEILKQRFRKI
jgi:hypothetical protein